MNRHNEDTEKELVRALRQAEADDNLAQRNLLFDQLQRLYADDAARLAARVFPADKQLQAGLKLHLLASLKSPIDRYNYDTWDSFARYVFNGWKQYAVRDYLRQYRTSIISIDARFSGEGDEPTQAEMLADSHPEPPKADAADMYEWLCSRFGTNDPDEQAALRDTIIGEAGPLARRLGMSILSRHLEQKPTLSRFRACRLWADVRARRKLWKELAKSGEHIR
jgi:hypothetical protein